MGARLWYRSCPAVSQISNFTVVSSRHTDWARKAARHRGWQVSTFYQLKVPPHTHTNISQSSPPIVVSWNSSNCPLTNRSTRLDLPTAMSPSSTNLNWQIFVCGSVPLERPPLPLELIPACVGDSGGWGVLVLLPLWNGGLGSTCTAFQAE